MIAFSLSGVLDVNRSLPMTVTICIFAVSGGDILNIQTESDKSCRVTTEAVVFSIPQLLIEPLTRIVIYFFQIRHMSAIVIVRLVNIHHFHPKDYTSYLKWYSIKYDRRNTEWSVLAWICLMLWKEKKKEKKNTLLELRWKSRLVEETALRFLCQCHVPHFILHCFGDQIAERCYPWAVGV